MSLDQVNANGVFSNTAISEITQAPQAICKALSPLPTAKKVAADNTLPTLDSPTTSVIHIGNLSEESIMQMLGLSEKANKISQGKVVIKQNSEKKQRLHAEMHAKIQEAIKKAEESEKKQKASKAWGIFKFAASVIGFVAAVAAAIPTGGGSLIAGAVLLGASAVNSGLDLFSDGKLSITAGMQKLCGDNHKTLGAVIGTIITVGIDVAAFICTLGASGAAKAGSLLDKAKKITDISSKVLDAAGSIGQGVTQGQKASIDYDRAKIVADNKKIEALISKLGVELNQVTDAIKDILEKSEAIVKSMKDVIDDCAQTQTELVSAPSGQA